MINVIDLCSGIGAFATANRMVKNSPLNFLGCSEITPFCNKVLAKHGHTLLGDLYINFIPEEHNPLYQDMFENDKVFYEEHGYSPITYMDLMEGVVDWPQMGIAGFPCQNVSSANLLDTSGIHGDKSSVIDGVLDHTEFLELDYLLLENTQRLNSKGLCEILTRLNDLKYHAQWETIGSTGFGYPYYRHRTFVMAYKEGTALHNLNEQLFAHVAHDANKQPGSKFPLFDAHSPELVEFARVHETKGNYRRARINALGNTVNLDMAFSIINSFVKLLRMADKSIPASLGFDKPSTEFKMEDLPLNPKSGFRTVPTRGHMENGRFFTDPPNRALCPTNTAYKHLRMLPSLVANDRKNNFTSGSRTSRPGGLGGLVGSLTKEFGLKEGGLNPDYCELYLGFEQGFTSLPN
ncbi:hypothetical protein A1QO_04255 [Vibrio genomosp. F10 str. ZF-129]|uniref:Uncharacterized protein n=1 Tax=Vibrio genomosp. F10 str. ZF-129 TaxID=1187848 RepID=A0A1E5BIP9_9VIBR|nr:DNA cytosine methyltransferase [Vibrio genomosp. F10]OEE37325.1 hypothetical protein A1QO_04255 [Vibrio genomosp. F10 str. ZF-129]